MTRVSQLAALVLALLAVPQAAPATRPTRPQPSPDDLMVERINAVRAAHDMRPLGAAPRLTRSAQRQAERLMDLGAFGHAGFRVSGFSSVGEALAYHRSSRPAVSRTVRRWLRSTVHRSLVLGQSFRWVGAGHASGRIRGRRTTIWVLRLGRR